MVSRSMATLRPDGWGELQEALFVDAWDPALGRHRSPYAFRGLSDASYRLETTLIRLGGDFEDLERHLLRNFRKYAHRDVVERDSLWHWLSLAQHHGLPTRLMDWTYSPYAALHFATSDVASFGREAAIWAVNFRKAHELLPDFLRSNLDEGDVFTVEMLSRLETRGSAEGAEPFSVGESPGKTIDTLGDFDALSEEAGQDFLLFFEPPSMDDRIVNQFALFSVMTDPTAPIDGWLEEHPDLFHKIVIPADPKLKWEIRDKLDQANITERVLFPGLDGLSAWLKRYYAPKSP
jgi:hypothetical protein